MLLEIFENKKRITTIGIQILLFFKLINILLT